MQEQGTSEAVKKASTGENGQKASKGTSGGAAGEPVASSSEDARTQQEQDTSVERQVRVL